MVEIVVNSPFVDFFLLFSFFFPFFFALIITVEYRFRLLLSRLFFFFLSFLTESLSLKEIYCIRFPTGSFNFIPRNMLIEIALIAANKAIRFHLSRFHSSDFFFPPLLYLLFRVCTARSYSYLTKD